MQITHEEARKLIQLDSDHSLVSQEKNTLLTHLDDCVECRAYAQEIREVESILLPAMKRHWDLKPAPLSLETILTRKNPNWQARTLLVTRTTLISLIFAAFAFSAWQFTRSDNRTSTPMPMGVLPIPTPSGQSTSTKVSLNHCGEFIYRVRDNDTLGDIAAQFSLTKDTIMAINHLSTETIKPNMELLMPHCTSTPTGTIHPSTQTITFTPFSGSTTATPGG